MRKIGTLEKREQCECFIAYLRSKKIDGEFRESGDKEFEIWVYDEDLITLAVHALTKYQTYPESVEFSRGELKAFFAPPPPSINKKRKISNYTANDFRVTWWLMGTCLAITILAQVSFLKTLIYQYLFFSVTILEGQIWRLVTPALIHTDPIHFIFNMFWIYDLGSDVEREDGSRFFLLFFAIVAMFCNIAQFFVSGPAFNGMSGVVYGLVGYVWMMSRYAPATRYGLSDAMMLFMVCWILVGLIFPGMNMANTQHIMGILLGLLLGSVKSGHMKSSWRQFRRK